MAHMMNPEGESSRKKNSQKSAENQAVLQILNGAKAVSELTKEVTSGTDSSGGSSGKFPVSEISVKSVNPLEFLAARQKKGTSYTMKDFALENDLRSGNSVRAKEFNSYLDSMQSFSGRIRTDFDKRSGKYQTVDSFQNYQADRESEIAGLRKKTDYFTEYFTRYGRTFDDLYGFGASKRILEGLHQDSEYLAGVSSDLSKEGDYWKQFKDEDQYRMANKKISLGEAQADIASSQVQIENADKQIAKLRERQNALTEEVKALRQKQVNRRAGYNQLISMSQEIAEKEAEANSISQQIETIESGKTNLQDKIGTYKAYYWEILPELEGFEQGSAYIPPKEEPQVSKISGISALGVPNTTYDVTGFTDILYDYINGNPIARQVIDANDVNAKGGTETHSHYKDLPEETVKRFNWLYRNEGKGAAYEYLDTVTDKNYTGIEALLYGTMQGAGTVSIAEALGSSAAFLLNDDELKKKVSDEHIKFQQDLTGAREQHPIMATAGEVGGNLAMLSTLGSGIGAAGKTVGAGKAATTLTGRAVNSAVTFMAADAVRNAGAAATGNMSPEEYGKTVAISGVQGLAGGLAEGLVSTGVSARLTKAGLMTPFMEFVRQSSSGFAAASANIGTGYALREEKPTKEQMATDFVTAFLFSVIRGAISTSQTTQADKAKLENAVGAIGQKYDQMAQEWKTMSPAERAAMAGEILEQTRQLQTAVNSTYIAGQQETVNQLNAALDYISSGMEGYVSGIQPYQPFAGGAAAGGSAAGGNFAGLPFTSGGTTSASEVATLQNQLQAAITQGISEPAGSELEGIVPVRTGALPEAELAGAGHTVEQSTETPSASLAVESPGAGLTEKIPNVDLTVEAPSISTAEETHSPEMQKVMEEYEAAVDPELLELAEKYRENPDAKFERKNISPVGQRQQADLERILGGDFSGYTNAISKNGLLHTEKRHGISGEADHSMANLEDVARTGYVLDNYDTVELLLNPDGTPALSKELRNKNDEPAYMVRYSKRVDGTVHVIEAAADNAYKKLWVVSTYKNRAEGITQALDAVTTTPRTTSETPLPSLPSADSSISGQGQNVNTGVFGEMSLHMTPMEALQWAQNRAGGNATLQKSRNGGSGYGSELAEQNGAGAEIAPSGSGTGNRIAQGGTADSGQVALSDGNPRWRSYERETGRHERVPETVRNAGKSTENRIIVQGRRAAVREYDAVSPDDLSVPFGSKATTCRVLPESDWDSEIQRGVEWAYGKGIRKVVPIVGEIQLEQDGRSGSVAGTINEATGEIFVRCDTVITSFSENLEHEVAHQMATPNDAAAFEQQVKERFGDKAWTTIFNTYRQRYSTITNGFAGMEESEIAAYISEEIMADAYSGADKFGTRASLYGAVADEVLEGNVLQAKLPTAAQDEGHSRLAENTPEMRGPPEEQLTEKQLADEDALWNQDRFAVDGENVYSEKSMTEDSELYSYNFLTSLPDMQVVNVPELREVRNENGRIDAAMVVKNGMKNARSNGYEQGGRVFVRNRYTDRPLQITAECIRHGLSGKKNRLLTNARLCAAIGDVIKNAVPINALYNKAEGVTGTYAMAAYATDSDGREFVVIATIEQRNGRVSEVEAFDAVHAVSGRQKRRQASDPHTRSRGFTLSNLSDISISDFLEIVNSTHQSILSDDVLKNLGEDRNQSGEYAGKVKFSLEDPVEETADLIALHNLTEEKLLGDLQLGGFPMPSIAVTKTDIPHTNFGDITLVMSKSTIDPQADRRNTVYSADTWTPTFPQVEYEADQEVERRISERLLPLENRVDDMFRSELYPMYHELEDMLNRYGGEKGVISRAAENYGLKAAYLEEQGKHVAPVMRQVAAEKGYQESRRDKYEKILDILGTRSAEEIGNAPLKELQDQYGSQLEAVIPGITKGRFRLSNILEQVRAYLRDTTGEVQYKTVADRSATLKVIDNEIDKQEYQKWLNELYRGVEGASGIYNNTDPYTPSGNRKSFWQMHYAVTLENIVKAMAGQNKGNTKNIAGFNGVKTLRAGTAERFGSIDEMHQREGRLQNLSEKELERINDDLHRRLSEIMNSLLQISPFKNDNQYMQMDSIGEILEEIAESGSWSLDRIKKTLLGYRYSSDFATIEKIKTLLDDISDMPVNMFEAKPERVVGFDEVLSAIVPDNSSEELLHGLENAGVLVQTYAVGDNADRLKKVNSVENARFAVSDEDEDRQEMMQNLRRYVNGELSTQDIRNYIDSREMDKDSGYQKPIDLRTYTETQAQKIVDKARKQNISVEEYLRENWELYDENGSWDKEAREALKLERKSWRFAASEEGKPELAERKDGADQSAGQKTEEQLETEFAALQKQLREMRKEMQARKGEQAASQKVAKKPSSESRPILAKRDLKRNLLSLFSVPEGQKAELGKMIDSYADQIWNAGKLTQQDMDAFFDRMYEEGVMEVPADSYFQMGREAVKGKKIYVNDSIRAEFGDDWGSFVRKAFNSQVYLTNDPDDYGPDVWNQELAEVLPGIFDDRETDSRAVLEQIVQVAEEGKAQKMSLAEYASSLADEGYVSEDEVLDNLERQMDWALRTFAEKASLEVHLRNRTGVKLDQERAKRKESMERQRNNRELRELQKKTLKQLQWLSKNQFKAPEDLRQAFQDVLGDIDILAVSAANEMNWSKKYNATWKDLKEMYQAAKGNDPNFLPSPELEKIVERLDKEKIEDMDPGALQDLYRAAVGLRTEFYNRKNVIDDEQKRLFDEVYRGSKEEIESAGKGYRSGAAGAIKGFFNYEEMTPINVLEMMGGWDPDGTFFSMAKQLEKGERDMRDYEVRAKRILDGFIQEHKDWIKKSDGQGKDAIWYEIEVPELMQLNMGDKPIFGDTVKVYMTPAQKVHMYLESKNYDNLRHMAGGRTFANKKLYSQGKRTEAFAQGITVKLAPETVKKLVADLTPEEEELARVLTEYYNTFAAKEINRVSNSLYGYDKAIGKNYAPIYTNQNYTKSEIGIFDSTAEGVGNLKARQYSKNPSYNLGAFDAFERHIKQTSRFVGMAIPARNWNTLLNWREQSNSMADVITHRFGDVGKQYITDLLTSLQSGGKISEKGVVDYFTDKALSKYVSAVFGFNPGIVFKQAASFPQFAAALGWKNLSLGRVDENLINAYTSELAYRKLGYATPETALLKNNPGKLSTNKAYQFVFGGGAITAMDAFTVKRAWTWAEKKVRNEHPELEVGAPEQIAAGESPFYKKVAEEWENAVSLTQPMYDEMHRANIMKKSSGIARAFTMFKTVPLQQYNTLRRNLGELGSAKRKYEKAKNTDDAERTQRAQKRVKRASWAAAAAVTAVLGGIFMLEAVEFLNQLWKNRGKGYRDKEGNLTFESIMERVLWNSFGDSMGMVTFGGELADWIENIVTGSKWYGIEIPGGEQLDDIIESVSGAGNTIGKFVEDSFNVISNGGDWGEYVRRNAGDYLGAAKEILEKVSMYLGGFPMENMEKYLMGSLPEEIKAKAENAFNTPTKNDLKGLSGGALEARAEYIFGARNVQIGEDAAAKISELYHVQFTDAVPADTPSKVTVGEEERALTAYQKQTYDRVWGSIVQDSLDFLVTSESFQNAEAETQAKMLKKLYGYADAKAKSVLYDDFPLDGQFQKVDKIVEAGGTAADWAAWTAESSGMKAEEKYLALAEKNFSDEVKKAIIGNETGTEPKTESGEDSQYAKMLKLLESGMDMTDYLLLKAQGSDAVNKYVKYSENKRGLTYDEYSTLKDNNAIDEFDKFSGVGLKADNAYDFALALENLGEEPSTVEKYMAIAETPYPEEVKDQALEAIMSDSAYARYQQAAKSGINTYTYCKFLRDIGGYSGDGKQEKVWAYINALPLSAGQKDALHLSVYKESSLRRAPWH